MAPTADRVQWQTSEIIKCLLEDEGEHDDRALLDAGLEVDSPGGDNDDKFDAVLIADKLRTVADALNDNMEFKAALNDLKKAAAQEAVDAAFSHGVDAVCQRVSQQAEVAAEVHLIRASVALGLYVKKTCPELKGQVQTAMTSFLNRRVGSWVTKQGGWDKVPDV